MVMAEGINVEELIGQAEQALSAARAAADRAAVGRALLRLSEAHLLGRAAEPSLEAGTEALAIFQELGLVGDEAAAQLCVSNAHLGQIALQAMRNKFPARVDTVGALRAAKAALKLFGELDDVAGKERATRTVSSALLATGVPANMVPNPEQLVQTIDVAGLVGELGGHGSPFQEPALEVRNVASGTASRANAALTARDVFEPKRFKWRDPLKENCYALIWEPYEDKGQAKPNQNQRVLALSQGARSTVLPLYHSLKPHDPTIGPASGDQALCVHINTYDCSTNYGASLMASLQTISAMVVAKLRRLTFVQVGEAPLESMDSPNALAARQISMSPCTLALLRSARIEAPQLSIGFVAGDLASWMSCREELVSAVFDSIDSEETELMWSRTQPMMPTLIEKPLPEPTMQKKKAPHDL